MSVQLDPIVLLIGDGQSVICDQADAHLVSGSQWRFVERNRGKYYVVRGPFNGRERYLHRLIIGAQQGQIVDHINGNTLDNRRCNLRIVTASQNGFNKSPRKIRNRASRFKGVGLCKQTGRWRAMISDGDRYIHLGRFDSEAHAAFAYDTASLQFHGEFGRRNFLPLC